MDAILEKKEVVKKEILGSVSLVYVMGGKDIAFKAINIQGGKLDQTQLKRLLKKTVEALDDDSS